MDRIDITGNKNVDLIILSNLDDKSLFSFSISNPKDLYLKKLCGDEDFWRNRLKNNFLQEQEEQEEFNKIPNRSWKQTYLALVYYSNKYFPNKAMRELAKGGMKNIDLIQFFIQKGADNWDLGMEAAAEGGHKDLVQFFIEKGANYWNWGMHYAEVGGYKEIVEFFVQKQKQKNIKNYLLKLKTKIKFQLNKIFY